MKKIKYIFISLLLIGLLGGCTDGWEDLNSDPNNPVDVPAMNILTYVERASCATMFGTGSIQDAGSYAGHTAKIQYIDESRYEERDGTFNGKWSAIMGYQVDLNKVIEKAQAEGNTNLEGIAMIIRAWLYQNMTDYWGAIPFLEGAMGEDGIIQPSYDSQASVYAALLTMLESANTMLIADVGIVTSADIWFGGDIMAWRKFANSLHLRVAIRMSNVDQATAATEIAKIVASSATYPIFTDNDDMAALQWDGVTYREPWTNNYLGGRDDFAMGKKLIDDLLAINDPRLPEYALPATADGVYRGVEIGITEANEASFQLADISRIGTRYRNTVDGYSYIMRYSELMFILAEAYERGLATGDAQVTYEAGITASLEEHDIAPGIITNYLAEADVEWDNATGALNYSNLEKIYYQKWISLFKQGNEAWAETRRTDIPVLPHAPGSPFIGNGFDRPPFRWQYPVEEYTYNKAVVEANDDGIVDNFWGDQMWWDTRSL